MKKYELTDDTVQIFSKTLHRVKALCDFGDVKAGDLGGYIESESNLSHDGDAWVYGNARVYGDAWVCGNARVYGDARVYGNARVSGNAWVSGDAEVYGNARVYGDAEVYGNAKILCGHDYAVIAGFGSVCRATTFFRCADGLVRTRCGCFYGTLDEFRGRVKETHGDSKIAKEYLVIADLMEVHFKEKQ